MQTGGPHVVTNADITWNDIHGDLTSQLLPPNKIK